MAEEHAPALRVEVLGPLRLVVDGAAVDVRGPKRRALLAMLALAEGRTVPVDHLLDTLWPAEIAESGRQALHTQVSRLRAHLGPAAPRLHARQTATCWSSTNSTWRGPGRCSPRRHADPTRSRCCAGPRAVARSGPRRPRRRGADRHRRRGMRAAAQEVTDALVDAAVEAGRGGRGRRPRGGLARRRPAARARGPAADARAGGDRAGAGGAAGRARPPPPAGRGDRPRPVAGAGRTGARHRRRRRRSPAPAGPPRPPDRRPG